MVIAYFMRRVFMEISIKDWNYEKERLSKTLKIIELQLEKAEGGKQKALQEVKEIRKDFWSSEPIIPESMSDLNTIVGITQNLHSIKREEQREETISASIRKLNKLKVSPYFARVDFVEEDSFAADELYIGISTLIDEDNEIIIYDWRAPVSSLFYENETGKAAYFCPEGKIDGEILLKRQYGIINGKLDYMFNSSIKIDDEILQKTLSHSSDEKMKTIITSIQKEQNKAIRDEANELLIVQGPAGSGKTSIALHRAAYILYRYRYAGVMAENIVIFSPNDIFNDFISEVLPELGENNIYQTTFMDYAKNSLPYKCKVEDANDQIEYILSSEKNEEYFLRKENIAFKGSLMFVEMVKEYIKHLEAQGMSFSDIKFKEWIVITSQELNELFYKTYSKWPIEHRFREMLEDIEVRLKPIEKERAEQIEKVLDEKGEYFDDLKVVSRIRAMKEIREFKDNIKKMLSVDALDVYKALLSNKELVLNRLTGSFNENLNIDKQHIEQIFEQTLTYLMEGTIKYEDVAPLVYIKHILGSGIDMSYIKYVIIDEAQDYSPFQYCIFKQLFPKAGFTILGDINQAINPYLNTTDYSIITDIFNDKKTSLIELSKSYRSTKEISDFTKKILDNLEIENVNRRGRLPQIIEVKNDKDRIERLLLDIKALKTDGIESIAIICRTKSSAERVYMQIKSDCADCNYEVNLLKKDDARFSKGISVIPSYLAKGLEFDGVLVFEGEESEYCNEDERKLFYTVCTRALHVLHIYYLGKPTNFIISEDKA